MNAVHAPAKRPGALADVVGTVDPTIAKRRADDLGVLRPENGEPMLNQPAGLFERRRWLEARIEGSVEVVTIDLVQAKNTLAKPDEPADVRGNLLVDLVHAAVVNHPD